MEKSEAQLIAAAISSGDRQAFGALVLTHQSAVRLVIRRWTGGDEAWADDLAQETFIRAYHGIMNFRGDSKFLTWLCQIAYHVFVEQKRKLRPETELTDESGLNPARGLNLEADLAQAMACLSTMEQAAITLCFQNEFTHGEAAKIMDIPLGTLKSHVNRAKEKLARLLDAWKREG